MRKLLSPVILAAAVCSFASCTQAPGETAEPAVEARSGVVTFAGEADGVSVYAFRENNSRSVYHEVYSGAWDADNRMRVYLPYGDYQFLFAKGFGDRLTLSQLSRETSAFDEAEFILAEHDYEEGYYGPADEIWLQDTQENAAREYTVDGPKTIPATLTRAVGIVSVAVKRGYLDGTEYTPVPYTDGGIVSRIDSLILTVNGAGNSLGIGGGSGSAGVYQSFYPADAEELEGGFATFRGPFVIPPGTGGNVQVGLSLIPTKGSDIPAFEKTLTARVERNRETQITLWINHLYPEIGLNISLEDITATETGDEGMWD